MKKFVSAFTIATIAVLTSCGNHKSYSKMNEVSTEEIAISPVDSLQYTLIGKINFIKLKEPNETFAEIEGIQVYNDTIYVFDKMGRNILMSFDKKGKHLVTFGERGNSKNEYTRLWSFDVDEQYVYAYDRGKKRMMYFTHDGKFVKIQETKFRGDSFKALPNGKFLFSLALEKSLNKLVLANNSLTIEKVLLSFNEKDKDNLAHNNVFQKSGNEIIYNKEMSDSVYVFSKNGECVNAYYINFGGATVPQEYKYNFERLFDEDKSNDYTYIDDCPILCGSTLLIPLTNKGKYGVLYYDLYTKSIKKPNEIIHGVTNLLCATSKCLYGWLDCDSYSRINKANVPEDIVSFMEKGGRVIVYSKL